MLFAVGDGSADYYSLRLEADPDWKIDLRDASWEEPVRFTEGWIAASITPPAGVRSGRVGIWVHRSSTGQDVLVEFELAVDAQTLPCGRA